MMRRLALVPIVALLTVVAGCIPPPLPLPPGELRPRIETVTVSPTPVVAGEALTLVVTARDDGPAESLSFEILTTFSGPWLNGWWAPNWRTLDAEQSQCGTVTVEVIAPHVASASVTCTLPADVPAGEWRTTVTVRDGVPNSFWGEIARFQVVPPGGVPN
jgi:hypothetical protein